MLITNSLTGDLISFIVALFVLLITFLKWNYQYWKRRNVPYLEPSIPFGNFQTSFQGKEHNSVTLKKIYEQVKQNGWKYAGIYFLIKPVITFTDLDLIRNILTKDFQFFADRDSYHNEKDSLQAHLLNLKGAKWKAMRAKLTPTFTSGKMKMMFDIMAENLKDLEKRMDQECVKNQPIDIKEVLACFTTNVIGSCAFGLEFKALEDENSPFRVIGRKMFKASFYIRMKRMFAFNFPKVAKMLDLTLSRKENTAFIIKMIEDIIDYREKNNYSRNDFMQMLINMKNSNKKEENLTMDELGSQVITFYAAGFETSSTLMSFAIYELAKHQNVQDKLRAETNRILQKNENKITYESIQEMTYLNQVIDETLRMHPPGAAINRKCVKDYKLPNSDVIIEKDTTVMISILGIHFDEDYYPNPHKFDPERFTEENKKKRHNYTHLPFGEGPRNCIGMRFGLLQAKLGLVALVKDYKFTVNKKTKEPIVYQPNAIVLAAEGEIWVDAEKIGEK